MSDTVNPERVGLSSERLRRVSHWMQRQLDDGRLPGLSVAVHRRGELAFRETVGHADVEAGVSLADDAIYRIYSMTKPVTSVALMMLYEQGRFQLDDPLAWYLPEFADMKLFVGGDVHRPKLVPARDPITVRHLLTHTSGLTYWFMNTSPVDAMYRAAGIDFVRGEDDLATMVRRVADMPLICPPGAAWNYSVSTDVLGRLVEVLAGMPLDRVFAEWIFEPLGMVDTGFAVPADKVDRLPALYGPSGGGGLDGMVPAASDVIGRQPPKGRGLERLEPAGSGPFTGEVGLFSGGGGLVSTMDDYLRFSRMLLGGGELDGVRLLGRKTLAYMTTNHLPGDLASMGQSRFSETPFDGIGFGLGFSVMLDPAKAQTMGTPGEFAWGGAASTAFWVDPAEEMIVVLMTQLLPSAAYPLRRELRVLTYQALVD